MTSALARVEEMAATFRALSDPTRLRIVRLLADEGEVFQKRLVQEVGANQPSVSRHLAYLKRALLVCERRKGRYAYLRLSRLPESVLELLRALNESEPATTAAMPGPAPWDAAAL